MQNVPYNFTRLILSLLSIFICHTLIRACVCVCACNVCVHVCLSVTATMKYCVWFLSEKLIYTLRIYAYIAENCFIREIKRTRFYIKMKVVRDENINIVRRLCSISFLHFFFFFVPKMATDIIWKIK